MLKRFHLAPLLLMFASLAVSACADDSSSGDANDASEVVTTDQLIADSKVEFLDYWWNNLDSGRFEQWFPEEHDHFAWQRAPLRPGDLGAEPGASWTSTETVGGVPHELVVTYVDGAVAGSLVTLERALVADVTLDGHGPYRLIVQYRPEADGIRVQQRLELPKSAGSLDPWRAHLEQRMTNLSGFVRELFQKEYVEGELMKRGSVAITKIGDEYELVITQNIGRLTPDMVDWWWDAIGNTERYNHWHPTAHLSFEWTTPPTNTHDLHYDVGAVQQIVEVIGTPVTLNIGWLDPASVPVPLSSPHFVYGSTNLDKTPFGGFLVHEYAALPDESGVAMKSTFRIPVISGMPFAQALGAHCIQEMQFLQYFVPRLYAAER